MNTLKTNNITTLSDIQANRAKRRELRKLRRLEAREGERQAIKAGVRPDFVRGLSDQKSTLTPTTDLEPGVVMMIRSSRGNLPAGLDNRFVAVHRHHDKGPELRVKAHRKLWHARLDVLPRPPVDFLKSGLAIWKQMSIHYAPDKTAALFRLPVMDQETSDAAHAAMLLVYNTAASQAELDTAMVALGAFMHAHPMHSVPHQVLEDLLPYGKYTGYKSLHPHPFTDEDELTQ